MMQVDSAVFPPHKKMLKLITQKFRAQSLNEVQPYEPQVRLRTKTHDMKCFLLGLACYGQNVQPLTRLSILSSQGTVFLW